MPGVRLLMQSAGVMARWPETQVCMQNGSRDRSASKPTRWTFNLCIPTAYRTH